MTERERVVKYLHQRVASAFNDDNLEQASHLDGLLSTIEGMTDIEYEGSFEAPDASAIA